MVLSEIDGVMFNWPLFRAAIHIGLQQLKTAPKKAANG
jgi:hypothetical protein